ncbi:hypothetical protein [Komagataeibacter swingsii]|uniref:Uncharacterized protein n=1 Tax=Komagataeibacter swingsii TaxID=215220 RepID=A0A850P092_9PROT|nr:hypothetical protein [Komagataeibacter swingsii]AHI25434.1 hypothetical protein H845_1490 [Komagataeibacter xylinus E25]NVN38085.1 hypothetical protein [Komagataeibacter swingsii]RFP06542.1 hypothetical protein BGC31_10320 [Komagataeibacter xylinus]RFP06750.1 hypothetical protein BFX83_15380 [Komagataeibacter xylinus]
MTIGIAALSLLWAVIIPAYWAMWLRGDHAGDAHPPGYVAHERAFLLPDLTLALLLWVTAILALRGAGAMMVTGLTAGGMMLFLGLIDLSYDLAQGARGRDYAGDVLLVGSACALVGLIAAGAVA